VSIQLIDRICTLLTNHTEGLTARQIAEALNVPTRIAVTTLYTCAAKYGLLRDSIDMRYANWRLSNDESQLKSKLFVLLSNCPAGLSTRDIAETLNTSVVKAIRLLQDCVVRNQVVCDLITHEWRLGSFTSGYKKEVILDALITQSSGVSFKQLTVQLDYPDHVIQYLLDQCIAEGLVASYLSLKIDEILYALIKKEAPKERHVYLILNSANQAVLKLEEHYVLDRAIERARLLAISNPKETYKVVEVLTVVRTVPGAPKVVYDKV